jgi:hypothetical protein
MITQLIVRVAQFTAVRLLLLVAAALLASCGSDRTPTAAEVERHSATAAKPMEQGVSVQRLKTPRSVIARDGRLVEKRVNVFYRTEFEVDEEPCGDESRGNRGKCFSLLGSKTVWRSAEPYVLDTSHGDDPYNQFLASKIAASLETWNSAAGSDIFGLRDTESSVDEADADAPDGKNEVLFASINEPGVIAVTIVWGVFSGKPADRELLEWDMVLDDPVLGELGLDLSWGDAGPTNELELGDTSIMDLQNIATHEAGHAAGLDHPRKSCVEETMYASASEGETKKRTLHTGDVKGITQLYP